MKNTTRTFEFHLAAVWRIAVWGIAQAICAVSPLAAEADPGATSKSAQTILDESGVQGGLIVHLGCGDGKLTAALRANDRYLVHGLDTDAANVAKARAHIRSLGLAGPVSVDVFERNRLPYVDNLVNLLVADKLDGVTMDEVMRVLAPLGVAHIGGKKTVKPWPAEIDEWTHYLHGADNNAVAADSVVGPPKRYQWICGPRWSRTHDHLNSLSALVSAKGRIFYIIDEAPAASVAFKPEWRLVARDAFSGVLLWRLAIEPWEGHLRYFRCGPTGLARRLVADGDRVFVTLGYGKPISVLDAATGETIRDCQQTDHAMEIALDEGVLFAVVGDREPFALEPTGKPAPAGERHWQIWREKAPRKHLVAIDPDDGKLLWKKDDADTREIMPTAMAVCNRRVFLQNEKELVALDAGSGKELWRAARPVNLNSPASSAPTLVAAKDVVICSDREVGPADRKKDEEGRTVGWYMYPHTPHSCKGEAIAYNAATGKRLWSVTSVENFRAPADLFVVDNKAFVRSNQPGLGAGIDLKTGEVDHPLKKSPIRNPGTHWRCYRNKATEKYLVLCQRRTEFYDLATGTQEETHWVRGTCQYGVMPCNGLLYAPHHSCSCSIESMLNSFNALASDANSLEDSANRNRLEKGPAFGQLRTPKSEAEDPDDWPTYRCDAARSGVARTTVGDYLTPAWKTKLQGPLTAPVVAEGMLITALPKGNAVHALRADSGKPTWTFATSGSVDSPPTIHRGRAIFGCADGCVYCLRVADGELVWRYRAAPADRRIVACGRVESIWPLHGSVLVQDGVVYAVAGRTTHMDGMAFHAIDLSTGRKLIEKPITRASFPDVLASDGANIFMRQLRLDKQGDVLPGNIPHLFSAAGFLDDTWWHRSYWQYGTSMSGGYTRWFAAGERRPAGRLMVLDDEKIYGFGRLNQYDHVGSHVGLGKTKYSLYAAKRSDFAVVSRLLQRGVKPKTKSIPWSQKKLDIPTLWKTKIDLLARGMVLSDKTLFVAGPPDLFGVASGDAPHPYTLAAADALRSQREALAGKQGSLLWAVSAEDGQKLSEHKLDGLPAWDGLVAAAGRLYLTMQDGTVACFSGQKDSDPKPTGGLFFNGKDLTGWSAADMKYWSVKDGAIVGHAAEPVRGNQFLWSNIEVDDFYLSVDVKLDPPERNAGIQFRSKRINDAGQACGYQADIGAGSSLWGKLYHEHGRGIVDWNKNAADIVKARAWNRLEILAVSDRIWITVNGTLCTAVKDPKGETRGRIALQIHGGPPQTVQYRINKLVPNPKVALANLDEAELNAALRPPAAPKKPAASKSTKKKSTK